MTHKRSLSRSTTWALTAGAAALFLLLSGAFGSGLLTGPLWNGDNWANSPLITYLLTGLIIVAGIVQANRLSTSGIDLQFPLDDLPPGQTPEPLLTRLLFGNVFWALLALPLRIFVGRAWLSAGLGKITNPAWTGTGQALHRFWQGAIAVNDAGQGKITYDWYRRLLLYMDTQHWYVWFAKLIAGGELLIGLGLLAGGLVGVAALSGAFLNFNYGLAGSASSNPILLALGVLLVLAWRTAGYWGLDRWLLPALGAPRQSTSVAADRMGNAGAPRSHPHAPAPLRPARSG
jgi:thiosulfate dehydrogenase [quinone] large subunit